MQKKSILRFAGLDDKNILGVKPPKRKLWGH